MKKKMKNSVLVILLMLTHYTFSLILSIASDLNNNSISYYFPGQTHNTSVEIFPVNSSLDLILKKFDQAPKEVFLITPVPNIFENVIKSLFDGEYFLIQGTEKDIQIRPASVCYIKNFQHIVKRIKEVLNNFLSKRFALITNECGISSTNTLKDRLKSSLHVFAVNITNTTAYDLHHLYAQIMKIKVQCIILMLPEIEASFITDTASKYNQFFRKNIFWVLKRGDAFFHMQETVMDYKRKEEILEIAEMTIANIYTPSIKMNFTNNAAYSFPYNAVQTHRVSKPKQPEHDAPKSQKGRGKPFIRFASVLYQPLVIEIPARVLEFGLCEKGLLCKIPIKRKKGEELKYRTSCCTGLIIEFLSYIMKKVEFDYEIYMVEDNTFGGFVNGSWTGIMKDVYTGKADIGLQSITTLYERSKYVDFTEPILASTYGIIRRTKTPQLSVVNWVFLNYLELELLILIIITFLSCSLLLYICENILLHFKMKKRYKSREVFTYLSGLLFQRDMGGKNPKRWASRIPCIAYATAMTIIMTTYTANLTASNIVYEDTDDFRGLDDEKIKNPTTDFKFGVMNNTSFQLYMMKKPKIYSFLKDYLVPNDVVALTKILNKELDGYIADYTYLKYLTTLPPFCSKLRIYEEKSVSVFSAFAVRKHSKWRDIFSQVILDIHETQKMKKLMNKWIFLKDCKTIENEAEGFPWRYFGGLLVITLLSYGVSLFVLLLERVYYSFKTKRKKPQKHSDTDGIELEMESVS